ncbi:MAG: helix-turn-helix domain-containing protein [Nitrospirota bacterium]|nr:helix-turn-helix domain-containing protein [Nitrospirota bacterium]
MTPATTHRTVVLPDIMTAQEVATLLRVTAHHVRDLAKMGELPHMRIGTEFRFVRDELIARYPNLRAVILREERHE